MLFNSLEFIIFIALFFLFWAIFKRKNQQRWIYLSLTSLFFYGWWDWRFLFLIIFSGLVDYAAGLYIEKHQNGRRVALFISVVVNIGLLAIFKYSGFIAQNLDQLFAWLGYGTNLYTNLPAFSLILPIGISFYTFQSMSYTIDVYRGLLKPVKNIFHFFSYLAMFPQLVAGPIVRAVDLLPQLAKIPTTSENERWEGFKLAVSGFFKKMVLADNLAPMVHIAFISRGHAASSAYWWVIIIAFAMQIYFDFSGYSDIARGIAKLMGYDFKLNFNHPYVANSLKDFWARWHISLSTWFRDYVYIPLGGNRKGKIKAMIFLSISFMLSGIWHGAAWTFFFWGLLHALFLIVEKVTKWPKYLSKIYLGKFIVWAIVMLEVLVAWVFFRAPSLHKAFITIKSLFIINSEGSLPKDRNGLLFLAIAIIFELIIVLKQKYGKPKAQFSFPVQVLAIATIIVLIIFLRGPQIEFIYFQF